MPLIFDSEYNPGHRANRNDFQHHAERMKIFRKSHPATPKGSILRGHKPALLEDTRPLHVTYITREQGGSRRQINAGDWSVLAPIWRIAQHRFSQD